MPFEWRKPKAVNRVSERQHVKVARRKSVREELLSRVHYCEAAKAGAPGNCYGGLTRHHVWPTGRGGPDCIENARIVCSQHNTAISQDAEMMRWAEAHDFIKDGSNGPAWIAAGGVKR